MDNHPIPQDITGFKFKLIGQMTIRQFIYLAIGAVIAWVVFFGIDPPAIIKWPLSAFALGTGALVAFVPIDGRPMDTMIKNFFSALTSPTKFVYQKENTQSSEPSVQAHYASPKTTPAQQPLANQPAQQQPATASAPMPAPAPPVPKTPAAPPPVLFPDEKEQEKKEPEPEQKQDASPGPAILPDEKEEMKKQIEELQKKLAEKEAQTKPSPQTQAPIQQEVNNQSSSSADELAEAQRQKEALEQQIIAMQTKQNAENTKKFEPVTAKPLEQTQNVRRISADMSSSAGIGEAPEAPNLITGIVKDSRGNTIQNILIEVLDTDGNPVRAFKTNKLGKFASATSLSNGNYIIKFEDPGEKHKFDTVQIELTGASVMPLEIISVDPREELRRELFN